MKIILKFLKDIKRKIKIKSLISIDLIKEGLLISVSATIKGKRFKFSRIISEIEIIDRYSDQLFIEDFIDNFNQSLKEFDAENPKAD